MGFVVVFCISHSLSLMLSARLATLFETEPPGFVSVWEVYNFRHKHVCAGTAVGTQTCSCLYGSSPAMPPMAIYYIHSVCTKICVQQYTTQSGVSHGVLHVCGVLHICGHLVTGQYPQINDDLVNSHHLLLCCMDMLFCAAMAGKRRDLLNPECPFLPQDFASPNFVGSDERMCVLTELSEKYGGMCGVGQRNGSSK